jgi:type I restriction enzyme S subunit
MVVEKGYKKTEVGVIPEDWEVKTVSKIGSIQGRVGWKGYTVKDLRDSGAYTIGAKHIDKQNRLDLSDPTFLSQEKYLESPEIMVNKNDILIVQRGTIGKVVLIKEEIGEATINPSMLILRLQNSISNYIFYYFISSQGQKQILNDTSSTGVPMITQKQVLAFSVPLPPLPEQTAIANALSDMDALIAQTEKLIEKKKAIKQGVMQELLKPKEGWVTKKLGEVLQYEQPIKYIVKSNNYSDDNLIPVLTAGKSFILGFTSEEFGVFSDTPTIIFDDFTTASQYVDFKFKVKSSAMKILKSRINGLNMLFMFEILQNIHFSVADHKRHWIGEFQHIEVILPGIEEMNQIGNMIHDYKLQIQHEETKLQKLKYQKQGMMQALLTGKIRLI